METYNTDNANIGNTMLPFVMRELACMVMSRKSLPLEDALHYIYTSRLYGSLTDERKKLWYSSTLSLYEDLEKEKAEQKKKQDNSDKVLLFKMFCIENYRQKHHLSAEEAVSEFRKSDVFSFLEETYEMLHTQDDGYILDSITTYIKKKCK